MTFDAAPPRAASFPSQQQLQHQLDLLAKVYASPAFESKEIIIMLNKDDLLEERLKKTELRKYFTSYRGDNSKESVIKQVSSASPPLKSSGGFQQLNPPVSSVSRSRAVTSRIRSKAC